MEEKKPLHSNSGASLMLTKDAINCLLHGQQHFQGMCRVFVIWNHYRKVPKYYRKILEVLDHYRKVPKYYRKILNVLKYYRELPVESCYGHGEFQGGSKRWGRGSIACMQLIASLNTSIISSHPPCRHASQDTCRRTTNCQFS
jgi:hypothetical protein